MSSASASAPASPPPPPPPPSPTRFGFVDATHAALTARHARDGDIVGAAAPGGVFKGASDARAYRALTLRNGLRVVLISDAAADKAAAACSVAVGHLADPPGVAGTAHAIEHLLFLGTQRYPDEGDYKAFLKAHGGGSNASTGAEATSYHFFVHYAHLPEALDRFAHFFIDPLLAESAVDRELHAIDAENAKNLNDDSRRMLQVRKHLSAEAHVFRKFGTGNLATLRDAPAAARGRALFFEHYQRHYAAGLMTLAVLGRQSLDELEGLVAGRGPHGTDFGAAPDNGAPLALALEAGHPYPASRTGLEVRLPPVRDARSLTLLWPAPDAPVPDYDHTPRLLAHLLGHEGPGSVLSCLKARGWASGLSAGGSANRHFATFEVTVSLTPAGLAAADDVVGTVYRYLALLRGAHLSELQRAWREVAQVAANGLRFRAQQPPAAAVTAIAAALAHYPAPDALVAGALCLDELDAGALAGALALLTPANMLLLRSAREDAVPPPPPPPGASATDGDGGFAAHTEPAYGLAYFTARFTPSQLRAWEQHGGRAELPRPACTQPGAAGSGPSAAAHPPLAPLPASLLAQAQRSGWSLAPVAFATGAPPSPPAREGAAVGASVAGDDGSGGDAASGPPLHLPAANEYIPTDFSLRPLPPAAAAAGAESVVPSTSESPAEAAATAVAALVAAEMGPGAVGAAAVDIDVLLVGGAASPVAGGGGASAPEEEAAAAAAPQQQPPVDEATAPNSSQPPFQLRAHPLDGWLGANLRPLAPERAHEAAPSPGAALLAVRPVYPQPTRLPPPPPPPSSPRGAPAELWHHQDADFRLPKALVFAQLALPRGDAQAGSARSRVLAALWAAVLSDHLAEATYAADVAGLSCSFDSVASDGAMELRVGGFSHQLPRLLRRVCAAVADLDGALGGAGALERVLERRLDALRRALLNNSKAQPYVRARQLAAEYTTAPHATAEAQLDALTAGVAASDVRAFARRALPAPAGGGPLPALLHQCGDDGADRALLVFAYGNTCASGSGELGAALVAALASPPQPLPLPDAHGGAPPPPCAPEEPPSPPPLGAPPAVVPRALLLPAGTELVLTRTHPNPAEPSAAVHVTWQLGAATPANLAHVQLLAMLASQPAFDALRTKEQLGYLVFSAAELTHGSLAAFSVTVQSANSSVGHLAARIDAWLLAFRGALAGMREHDVAAKAAILAQRLTERDKTQGAQAGRLWATLTARTGDWHAAEAAAGVLTDGRVTRGALLALLDACMLPGAPLLRRVVARVAAQPQPQPAPQQPQLLHGGGPCAAEPPHPLEAAHEPAEAFKARAVPWQVGWAGARDATLGAPAAVGAVWMPTARELARM